MTLPESLARKALPCQWIDSQSCDSDDPRRCEHCRMRPAVEAAIRKAIEACADEVLGWIVSYDGSPSTAIRALLTEEETP